MKEMRTRGAFAVALIALLSVSWIACFGCGAGIAQAADFSGKWEGRWYSDYGDSGGLSATVTQADSTLSGTMAVRDTSCTNHPDFTNIPISGTITNDVATVNASVRCPYDNSDNALRFTQGRISGNTFAGYYTITSDGEYYDSGTFAFNRVVRTITATAGAGGAITPSGAVSVNWGADQTFAITPQPGYSISKVFVDGVSKGPVSRYTFSNVTTNHTISAAFSGKDYTITAIAGSHGAISPAGTVIVSYGESRTFTITPAKGYRIDDVVVDGDSVGAVKSYTFSNITANHRIAASFTKIRDESWLNLLLGD